MRRILGAEGDADVNVTPQHRCCGSVARPLTARVPSGITCGSNGSSVGVFALVIDRPRMAQMTQTRDRAPEAKVSPDPRTSGLCHLRYLRPTPRGHSPNWRSDARQPHPIRASSVPGVRELTQVLHVCHKPFTHARYIRRVHLIGGLTMQSGLRGRVVSLVTLVLFLAAGPAFAQQTESRIIGKVIDSSKLALPGVTVTVVSKSTGASRDAVTDGDGTFAVTNLGPGAYTVTTELAGFQKQQREVVIGVGQIESIAFELPWRASREQVTVTADAPVLDVSSAKIGVNVSPEEVQNLPVNGRNFANLMTLATGATSDGNGGWASVRFNGKSNQQNYLNYDGVDGTYVWDASPGYLNATGSQFRLQTSMESVAEFRVNSGLAPAESGLGRRRQHHGRQQERRQQLPRARSSSTCATTRSTRREVRRPEAAARAEPVRRLDWWPDRAATGRSSSSATKACARRPA